ncbi:MAG TPA: hypothetical protein ENJ57_06470, partial [Rhizobiales bacterium]|nr:hypothetical protein [Hyphomicrobiales bacterium]
GLTAGMDATLFKDFPVAGESGLNYLSKMDTLGPDLIRAALKTTVSTAVSTAIQGGKFGDALLDNLKFAAVSTIGEAVTEQIGLAAKSGKIDQVTRYIAHAAVGCAIGAASSGSKKGCGSGALGATVGELAADLYKLSNAEALGKALENGDLPSLTEMEKRGVDLAQLAGGFAAFLVHADVNIAANTARNAAENNSFRLMITALKFAAKLTAKLAKKGRISENDLRRMGFDELMGILEDGKTLIDPDASLIEKALAVLSLATGLDPKSFKKIAAYAKEKGGSIYNILRKTCSFDPNTPILMADGTFRPIVEVRVGDRVASRNEFTGRQSYRPVTALLSSLHEDRVVVELAGAGGKTEKIVTTLEHPFHIEGLGFVPAGGMKVGMKVTRWQPKADPVLEAGHRDSDSTGSLLHRWLAQVGGWLARLGLAAAQPAQAVARPAAGEAAAGPLTVRAIQIIRTGLTPWRAYNLTVAQDHTFYVGTLKAWVHNARECDLGDGTGLSGRNWQFNDKKDVDWRGTEATYRDALDEAFKRTGYKKDQFTVTKWGRDKNG